MTRLLLLAALVAAPLAPNASAQISISRADVAALYAGPSTVSSFSTDSSDATRAALQAIATRTGANQTWTFTGLAFSPDGTITSTPVAAPRPGSDDPHFAPATLIVQTDTLGSTESPIFSYSRLSDDAFVTLGAAIQDEGSVLKVKLVPGLRQPLPYTAGSAWTSESAFVIDPAPFPGEQSVRQENTVVGWGTLVTPGGRAEALMVRTLDITRSRFVIPGLPPIESADSTLAVSFVTRGRMGASIALDPRTGLARDAAYTTGTGGTASDDGPGTEALRLTVGPTPARRGPVAVRLEAPGPVDVAVYDALGREVAVLVRSARGELALTWDASAVPPGLYLVRARTATASAVRSVVVTR